jgi:hypothetical protein
MDISFIVLVFGTRAQSLSALISYTSYISDIWPFTIAEVIQSHENVNVGDIGKGEAQHRK